MNNAQRAHADEDHGGPGHDHGHNHAGHSHASHSHAGHSHAPASFGRAFAIGATLNIGFVVIEAIYGIISQSTALLADAGHNLADVLGLLAAWAAAHVSGRAPTERFTWGMRQSTVLVALGNAVLLFVGAGAIGWEAIGRFRDPPPVAGGTVMVVAAIGIVVNGATALLFARGRANDLNIRGAFLHMAVDALVSAGVLVAGAIVLLTGWTRADPLVGLAVAAFIVWSTWGLFRDSVTMSMAAVPASVEAAAVRSHLAAQPGVAALHDLHIWPVGTTEVALSAHLVMPDGHPGDAFLLRLASDLRNRGIGHVTIQVETGDGEACPLLSDQVL